MDTRFLFVRNRGAHSTNTVRGDALQALSTWLSSSRDVRAVMPESEGGGVFLCGIHWETESKKVQDVEAELWQVCSGFGISPRFEDGER